MGGFHVFFFFSVFFPFNEDNIFNYSAVYKPIFYFETNQTVTK